MAVPVAEINRQVVERLRKLSRNVKMPGFRPGKVPMKMIEQSYGPQVHAEVLGDAVSKAFSDAVDEHKLRVAGQPRIESREGAAEHELGFTATFEVYPEVALGDPATLELERVSCQVGDAEVDKTVEILRKQRVTWAAADRAAQDGDRVTIDFVGTLDGVAFEGGSATGFRSCSAKGACCPISRRACAAPAPAEDLPGRLPGGVRLGRTGGQDRAVRGHDPRSRRRSFRRSTTRSPASSAFPTATWRGCAPTSARTSSARSASACARATRLRSWRR